jgi:hypothetical protein
MVCLTQWSLKCNNIVTLRFTEIITAVLPLFIINRLTIIRCEKLTRLILTKGTTLIKFSAFNTVSLSTVRLYTSLLVRLVVAFHTSL